jgi:hypothetical protein
MSEDTGDLKAAVPAVTAAAARRSIWRPRGGDTAAVTLRRRSNGGDPTAAAVRQRYCGGDIVAAKSRRRYSDRAAVRLWQRTSVWSALGIRQADELDRPSPSAPRVVAEARMLTQADFTGSKRPTRVMIQTGMRN